MNIYGATAARLSVVTSSRSIAAAPLGRLRTGATEGQPLRPRTRWRRLTEVLALALILAFAAAAGAQVHGVHVVRAAPHFTPPAEDRPFDLAGRTLLFTPSGGGYSVAITELQYETDRGAIATQFHPDSGSEWHFFRLALPELEFPFAGSNRKELFVYAWPAVFFTPPQLYSGRIFEPMLSLSGQSIIAPFLLPRTNFTTPAPHLLVRQSSTAVILTWTTDLLGTDYWDSFGFGFDVQLQLRDDGTIIFSYRKTGALVWPAVGLWSGAGMTLPDSSLDLSEVASAPSRVLSLPLYEIFSVPELDIASVWRELQTEHRYRDDEIDIVAIYQDFHTDLVYYAAAFCNGGNAGVDGLMRPSVADRIQWGSRYPRRAALMHMNHVLNPGDYTLLLHEIAHRWLYYFDYVEDGQLKTHDGHPSYFTNTAGAFSTSEGDHSPLGGSAWRDNGDGTFTTAIFSGEPRYSWHELYFLGLAAPEEVAPWFYIDSPQPAGYDWQQGTVTYTGTRRPADLTSVFGANGSRNPPAATSQKHFRMVLVLITRDPSRPNPEALQRLLRLRVTAARAFASATGDRGSLEVLPRIPVTRRRAVGH
jgi:hypothetical protein